MHLGQIGRFVDPGEDLGGDGSIVDVAAVECLVGRWGADSGCDAEGGAVGEGGGAGEVEAVDAALVTGWIHGYGKYEYVFASLEICFCALERDGWTGVY